MLAFAQQTESAPLPPYAFISYSTKNQIFADSLRELLKRSGICTWMAPYSIPAGGKYAEVINRAIRECACFVLLLTADTQNSIWVAKETERAVNYRKPIIPVQLDDVVLNDEFELYISTDQIVPLREADPDPAAIQKVLAGIRRYTGRDISTRQEKPPIRYALVNRADPEKRYVLKEGASLLGKEARKCEICIEDMRASRVHAMLTVTGDEVFVQDRCTANGTFLNGVRLPPDTVTALRVGDVISIGRTELELCRDGS